MRAAQRSRPLRRAPRPSQSQLEAIGLAGELVAYRWLASRYKDRFTDDCWVSKNRALLHDRLRW